MQRQVFAYVQQVTALHQNFRPQPPTVSSENPVPPVVPTTAQPPDQSAVSAPSLDRLPSDLPSLEPLEPLLERRNSSVVLTVEPETAGDAAPVTTPPQALSRSNSNANDLPSNILPFLLPAGAAIVSLQNNRDRGQFTVEAVCQLQFNRNNDLFADAINQLVAILLDDPSTLLLPLRYVCFSERHLSDEFPG